MKISFLILFFLPSMALADVSPLPNIKRTTELQYLKESIWTSRTQIKQRRNSSSEQNFFHTNEFSFDKDELKSLLQSYLDFFAKHEVDVEIDADKLSQELVLQVESLATYIEDLLIMQRINDPVLNITYMNSTKNLLGGLVINHKYIIKRGRKNQIVFSIENGKQVSTITYKKFVPRKYIKMAEKPALIASEDPRYSKYYDDLEHNKSRYSIRYMFSGWNGILMTPTSELGYLGADNSFIHVMSYALNSGVRVKDFMSPRNIDKAVVTHYFKRVCSGMGIVYSPANLFISFPQTDMVKDVKEDGSLQFIQRQTGYIHTPESLKRTPRLMRGYDDVAAEDCSKSEIEQYEIKPEKINPYTGINETFSDYVTQVSMAYRFKAMEKEDFLFEVTCPVGALCHRDGLIENKSSLGREALGRLEIYQMWEASSSNRKKK